ncbi:hypothetical protein JCM10212_004685 [Sporobolomyces blumeae]
MVPLKRIPHAPRQRARDVVRLFPRCRGEPTRHFSTLPSPSDSPPSSTLAVIGCGLGGLSTAAYFVRALSPEAKRHARVVLFEKEPRVGGWCKAVRIADGQRVTEETSLRQVKDKLVFETGPRSIRPVGLQGWLTIELAHFVGLGPDMLTVSKSAPSAKNRYLYTPPRLTVLPSSILSILKSLVSPSTPLLRRVLPLMLLEPFRPRSKLHTSGHGDESVDAFFARRFGRPMADDMVSAMIHGIYAGDARRLSVRAVFPQLWEAERESGSVVLNGLFGAWMRRKGWKAKSRWRRNVESENDEVERIKRTLRDAGPDGRELVERMEKASVWGVDGGLQEITIALREWLESQGVEFRTGPEEGTVEGIERLEDGKWRIRTPKETLEATHLVTTLPSLLPLSLAAPRFPATTVSVVNLAFPASVKQIIPPGFGYLIPRTVPREQNPHHALGVLFDSDVMPSVDSSADAGLIKVSLLLGGSYWLDRDRSKFEPPSHDDLVQATLETLRLHFPHAAFPDPVHAYTHTHRDCIPQIPPHARHEILNFSKRLERAGNVAVVGGGFAAVGVNGAVKAGWEVGTGFAREVNGRFEGGAEARRGERQERKAVRRAARTGMEMWDV